MERLAMSGDQAMSELKPCQKCYGTGSWTNQSWGQGLDREETCEKCRGTGFIYAEVNGVTEVRE